MKNIIENKYILMILRLNSRRNEYDNDNDKDKHSIGTYRQQQPQRRRGPTNALGGSPCSTSGTYTLMAPSSSSPSRYNIPLGRVECPSNKNT